MMKRLLIIALALISIQGFAQQDGKERSNNEKRMSRMSNLTPEESANLQTKRMTLYLDLNEKQQKEIYAINLENGHKRKSMMAANKTKRENGSKQRPTKQERLSMEHIRLDNQIAMKGKMKSILNDDQFDKWEKSQGKMNKSYKAIKNNDSRKRGNSPRNK